MRRFIFTHIIIILGIFICRGLAFSADISYEVVPTEIARDTENRVFLQDKNGFVWVGTEFGVDVYDCNGHTLFGSQFDVLHPLRNLSVTTLFENGENIWIGVDKGLYVYDRQKNELERFGRKTKYGVVISSRVRKVFKGSSNKIWIATQGQGLFIYDPETGSLHQDSRHGSFYSDLAQGADGLIYAVTYDGKIQSFRHDGVMVKEYRLPDYVSDKNPFYLASSGRNIWVGSGSHLFCLNRETGSITPIAASGLQGTVNTLMARPDGNLIMSTEDGIWRYGTVTGDFSEIKPLRSIDLYEGQTIASISESPDGNIVIVRPGAPIEVMMIQPGPIRFVALSAEGGGMRNAVVRSFAASADGSHLWVGSDRGLFLYNLSTRQFEPLTDGNLSGLPVRTLALDGDKLWIGTKNRGVYRHDLSSGETRHYTYDENIPYSIVSNEINHIGITSGGEVLILTNWGVCRYDRIHDNFPQLPEFGQNIRAISFKEERDGTLWIGTANYGFFRKVPQERRFGMVPAEEMVKNPIENRKFDFDMRRYGAHNPMASTAIELKNGLTAMGANNGFLIIDPSKLKVSENSTFAYASALSFPFLEDGFDKLKELGQSFALVMQKSIKLPYKYNTFTIQISGIHPLVDPDIKFDYMLKGIDKDWIMGVSVPEVTYNNLSPGEYEFLVRPHGMENAETKTLKIEVTPPWYLSFWAIVAYLVLIALFGWGLFRAIKKLVDKKRIKAIEEIQKIQERETFEAKTRYFVDLVHEIRTPLMLISMPLEQLKEEIEQKPEEKVYAESHKYVKSMQENVDYLLGITNQLLDFRKAEKQSEVKLNIYRFDLCALIRRICHRFEEPLRLGEKRLDCSLPEGEVWIKGDVDKLERVLMNLIGNAMKYAESLICVKLTTDDPENVNISVSDDGEGIPEEERKKVFDTYYQIQSQKLSVSLGTGLGLAYARLITEAHNGKISIEDNPEGHGALFSLTIPRETGGDAEEVRSLTEYAYNPDVKEPEKKDITVMLVEDNEDLRVMISDTLEKYYNVVTAPDGVEALEILKDKDVDVIVSDVMMDRMNGMDLCRKVKNDIEYSHIPFVILTALTTDEAHEEGLSCGADVYLEKPFPIRQLVLQIENLLRTRRLFYERMKGSIVPVVSAVADTSAEPSVAVTNEKVKSGSDVVAETGAESVKEKTGLNRLDTEFLEKMNSIISESVEDEEFSIDVLAQNMNMSRSSFYRKITAVTGMSPNEYLKNFRLNKAAELLRDGCRVSEVSERVGFTSSSYFAKCFRAKFGVLPSEFK